MMAMDIHKTRFEAVKICGVPALFTVERVRRSELPNGIYAYDMQTSEEDWSQPCLLACHIAVLPVRLRDVALLYYFAGMSDPQIGQLLRLKPDTVQHRRAASLAKLRKLLGGSYGQ